ncbi:MAG: hypothetical protein JO090_15230 [Rhizobacter sp.]|nr:hypothetical protein [Rhizobacter sp.]
MAATLTEAAHYLPTSVRLRPLHHNQVRACVVIRRSAARHLDLIALQDQAHSVGRDQRAASRSTSDFVSIVAAQSTGGAP